MPADGYSPEGRPEGVPADAELEADLELVLIRKVCMALDSSTIVVCIGMYTFSVLSARSPLSLCLNLRRVEICINKILKRGMSWFHAQVETATDDGQVSVKLIKKGKNYKKPNEGATVKVAYTARIGGPDGPVFEEYSREDPLTLNADEGEDLNLLCFCWWYCLHKKIPMLLSWPLQADVATARPVRGRNVQMVS